MTRDQALAAIAAEAERLKGLNSPLWSKRPWLVSLLPTASDLELMDKAEPGDYIRAAAACVLLLEGEHG